MKKTIHIALTGHRPPDLGGYDVSTTEYQQLQRDLEQYIQYQLQNYQTVWCHSGLALGADTVWSKAILNMKEEYPNRIRFHAEIPMMSQSHPWFVASDISFWHKQVEKADNKTVYHKKFHELSDSERKRLAPKVLDQRNMGMVDHCDILLAIFNGKLVGGTANAIRYAREINRETVIIDSHQYFKPKGDS